MGSWQQSRRGQWHDAFHCHKDDDEGQRMQLANGDENSAQATNWFA